MKIIKLSTNLVIALSLAVGLTGCGDDTKVPPAGSEAKSVESFPVPNKLTLKMFAASRPEAGEYNEMQIIKDLEKQTNIHIDWTLVKDGLQEKKNLLFASNDLPDAFYGPVLNDEDLAKYGTQGQLIPLEKLIEQYAPNIKKMLAARPEVKKQITSPDGHIYFIPQIHELINNIAPDTLFVNKKWLDKLGLSVPKTTDEFYMMLKAFQGKDLNGNGKNDEIPFSFVYEGLSYGSDSLSGSFGITGRLSNNYLYVRDGKVLFAPVQPEYKEYIAFMNKLYSEKLIDPESFTQKNNVFESKLKSKDPLLGAAFFFTNSSTFGRQETDYVAISPFKGPKGQQLWNQENMPMLKAFSITSVNKYPELTMKWLDLSYEEKTSPQVAFGPYGVNLKEDANGRISYLPTPSGMSYAAFRHKDTPGSLGAYSLMQETIDKMEPNENTVEKTKYYNMYKPFFPKEIYPSVIFSMEDRQKMSKYQQDIHSYVQNTVPKWIINGSMNADWEGYENQLKKMGLEDMMKIYQKYYDAVKSGK